MKISEYSPIMSNVVDRMVLPEIIADISDGAVSENDADDLLITARAVANSIIDVNNTISAKRVNAVTTWGNDNATQLGLSNAQ